MPIVLYVTNNSTPLVRTNPPRTTHHCQCRQSLAFVDEEVAEDPQEGTQLQMPHLKGAAIEEMLITVYRRYCG